MNSGRCVTRGWWLLIGVLAVACAGMPSFDQQKRWVQDGDFRIHQLTPRAFVESWGQPTYTQQQFTHFFGMQDGRLIPQTRMALGESPQGWETGLAAGDALFLAYADRGRYLVFLDDALVYHEAMTAEKVHAVGKTWKYESQFKTRLESSPALK
ncbi:MAG: hypothetical protein H0V35_04030 [Nitrospira sp.]|nr:hypothetical protein [Nitrospira sp.]MBA3753521.1 hypothetical protein [Nitrospira sp.]